MFDKWKEQRRQKKELKLKTKAFRAHTTKLEKAMDRLFSEHMAIAKIEDAYLIIGNYVNCKEKWEYDYCKNYVKKLYSRAYDRYDEERLR